PLSALLAGLGAPHVDAVEFPRDRHRREHAHAMVELALEAHVTTQLLEVAGDWWTMHEHRERPVYTTTALDDSVKNRMVLGGDLVFAGDGSQPCHVGPPLNGAAGARVQSLQTCPAGAIVSG